ncbi:hypothetical protein RJ639_041958 [Escallonia herrerae]|uniref:Small acidic protein 1 n=1 Tax=Escallonia herrerae TaxID=1293975 RepID=A0AA89BA50_9ASTE|nr:hypothetical protein RJ639_041958 [Escallonia herrerae]
MKPMPVDFFGEDDVGSAMDVDDDDVETLEIFGEGGAGPIAAVDHHRLADNDFFNSFEDDFDDSDIN